MPKCNFHFSFYFFETGSHRLLLIWNSVNYLCSPGWPEDPASASRVLRLKAIAITPGLFESPVVQADLEFPHPRASALPV